MKKRDLDITIRIAKKEDVERIAEIEAICFPKEVAAGLVSFQSRFEMFGECFLVAELNGEIIGFINGMVINKETIEDIMFEDASLHEPDGMWQSVFGLDVLPEYRCRGYAEALMREFINKAKKEGRKGCVLTCKDRLLHYYNKFGYQNRGISESQHGGAVWYDMLLEF